MDKSDHASNFSWLISDKFIIACLGLAILPIVTRYLGPSDFGLLSYVFSLAALFTAVGHLGLDGLVVREIVSAEVPANEILGTVFCLTLTAHIAAAIGLITFGYILGSGTNKEFYILVCASAVVAVSPIKILSHWFHANVQAKYVSISILTGAFAAALGTLLMVYADAGVGAIAAVSFFEILIVIFSLFFFYRRTTGPSVADWKFSGKTARLLLSESCIVFAGSLLAIIYLKIDQVMLAWMIGTEEVGFYSVAAKLSEALYFIPAAIVATVFPFLIKARKRSESFFNEQLQIVLDVLASIAFISLIVIWSISTPLIELLFGATYQSSALILQIHVLAMPFIFMRYVFSRWILIEKLAVFSLLTHGVGAVMNVLLNYTLIPEFGGMGAAFATVISYASASYFALSFSRRTRPLFWMMSKSILMPWNGMMYVWSFLAARKVGSRGWPSEKL